MKKNGQHGSTGSSAGEELAEFEASLPDKAAAEAEKADAQKLGVLLKSELGARALTNEEFFSHQLRERIARESREPPVERGARLDLVDNSPPVVDGERVARRCFWFLPSSSCARKIRRSNRSILPKF